MIRPALLLCKYVVNVISSKIVIRNSEISKTSPMYFMPSLSTLILSPTWMDPPATITIQPSILINQSFIAIAIPADANPSTVTRYETFSI